MSRNYLNYILILCLCFLCWLLGVRQSTWWETCKPITSVVAVEGNLNDTQALDQQDKNLHYYVRSHHIFLPSVLEYSFGKNKKLGYIDKKVDTKIYSYFKNKKNGFFVEVGGYDGLYSHTLILEKDYQWTGLLIECNPEVLPILKSVNRKSYVADVCLSPTTHPVKTRMTSPDKWQGASSLGSEYALFVVPIKTNLSTFEVQTIPLYAILASIDVTEVDFFVLDIQSLELEVLKHFPFDLVFVKVWLVEVYFFSKEQRNWLIKYMDSNGYPSKRVIKIDNDFLFFHKSVPKFSSGAT